MSAQDEPTHDLAPLKGWSEDQLRTAAADLPPFDAPDDVTDLDEFAEEPPRSVHPIIRSGLYLRRWRRITLMYQILGLICVILDFSGLAAYLSFYILAFGYIRFIEFGILGILIVRALLYYTGHGPLWLAKHGVVGAGRVVRLGRQHVMANDDMDRFRFALGLEIREPGSAVSAYQTKHSEHLFAKIESDKYQLAVAIGEYIPLVGMRNRFVPSSSPYGFLGLSPKHNYILKSGKPFLADRSMNALYFLAFIVGGMLVIPLIMYGGHAFEIIGDFNEWAVAAVVVGAIAVTGVLFVWFLKSKDRVPTWNKALGAVGCGIMFGSFGGFLGAPLLNGLLDRTSGRYEEIEVVDYWQETMYPFFVRRYELEFKRWPGGTPNKYYSHPDEMYALSVSGYGVAEYGDGALGMEWIRGFHAFAFVPLERGDAEELIVYRGTDVDNGGGERAIALKAVAHLPDGTTVDASPRLRKHLWQQLAESDAD